MVGISPHLAVVYVLKAWGGCASDKRISQTSPDLLNKLKPSEVMSDRGFEIKGTLTLLGVELTIPDFKGQGRAQLSEWGGKWGEQHGVRHAVLSSPKMLLVLTYTVQNYLGF